MYRSQASIWLCRFLLTIVYGGNQLTTQIELRADQQSDSNQEAKMLVARMLQANKPWLVPSAIQGTYSLVIRSGGTGGRTILGPYALEKPGPAFYPGSQHAGRVGSILWTPLHNMVHTQKPCSVQMVGKTNWNTLNLIAVDVNYDGRLSCAIGFGGQKGDRYSFDSFGTLNHRILIEPTNALPIFIDSKLPANLTTGSRWETTWQFGTNFFAVNGGFAPQTLECQISDGFSERQDFQIINQEWIFKRGASRYSTNNAYVQETGIILTFELIDISILDISKLTIQKSGANIILSWPTYGKSGTALESVNSVDGLWSTLLSQITSDITNVSVTLPVNQVGPLGPSVLVSQK